MLNESGLCTTLLSSALFSSGVFYLFLFGFRSAEIMTYYVRKVRSVTTFSVYLSTDGAKWRNVSCDSRNGDPCVFKSNILASRPDDVVTIYFPALQEARYVKILPWTWEGKQDTKSGDYGRGGDLRLDIIGGGNVNLNLNHKYRLLSDGDIGYGWLQHGCIRDPIGYRE